jgi:hypothetical protein
MTTKHYTIKALLMITLNITPRWGIVSSDHDGGLGCVMFSVHQEGLGGVMFSDHQEGLGGIMGSL